MNNIPDFHKSPESSDSQTLVSSSPPETHHASRSKTVLDSVPKRSTHRKEHVSSMVDLRVDERFVQWGKKIDTELEWIEKKLEDRINERTQQLKNLLDERMAELEWSLITLSKSLAENDRLSNALEETRKEVRELKQHINLPEKPKNERYRRTQDPHRETFAKWRRNPATAGNRPLPINTQITSDCDKRKDLPLLTQSESPGILIKPTEAKATCVDETNAAPDSVDRGRRRERKRQREEESSTGAEFVSRKRVISTTAATIRKRYTPGRIRNFESHSPPTKRAKFSLAVLDNNVRIVGPEVGEWVDISLPDCFDKGLGSPHPMMLSPRRRRRMVKK